MKTFHIQKPDEAIKEALIDKINNLTKPQRIAWKTGRNRFANRTDPTIPFSTINSSSKYNLCRGSWHRRRKSQPISKEVTWQQISNFLHGEQGSISCADSTVSLLKL